MPLRVRLSPRAKIDLARITEWIAGQAGEEIALAYADRVEAACQKLWAMPKGGTPRPGMGIGYRSVSFEKKLILFFRVERGSVVVKRIVHGRRDLRRALRRRS